MTETICEEKKSENIEKIEINKPTDEVHNSLEFLKDLMIFGAFIFASIFILSYSVIQKDFSIKDAYHIIKQSEVFEKVDILKALKILEKYNIKGKKNRRLYICEEDYDLILFQEKATGDIKKKLDILLKKKFAADDDYKKIFAKKISRAGIPFFMPHLEQYVLYYSWIIEIIALIFLSQTIQKKHIQKFVIQKAMSSKSFTAIIFIAVHIPAWIAVKLLISSKFNNFLLHLILITISSFITWLLKPKIKDFLINKGVTEFGLYIFISALFMQFIGIMGDLDMVYTVYSSERSEYIFYVCCFIVVCVCINFFIKKKKPEVTE